MAATETAGLFGRDREFVQITRVLDLEARGLATLVLEGEPGIGKTTLWQAGIEEARRRGFRVLVAKPAQAECELSFAGLADLVSGVVGEVDVLPAPQRRALRVAVLLDDAGSSSVDELAVAAALLGLVRLLASDRPLLVAVDDAQWLDQPSRFALQYALRRLDGEQVAVLTAQRRSNAGGCVPERSVRLLVQGLPVAAIYELLRARLGRTFARPTLVRVHETARGNPFFALELARTLKKRELAADEPLVVPGTLRELVARRLELLPVQVRETLLLVAALARPTATALAAAVGSELRVDTDLRQAVEAEVLDRDGDQFRFTHPVLSSVSYAQASESERRAAHRRLAEVVSDEEQRARHLAAATDEPEAAAAAVLEQAGRAARSRGAPVAAGELLEAAARLTPSSEEVDQRRRFLAASECHFLAGATAHARELLEEVLAVAPAGFERACVAHRLASQLDRGQDIGRGRTLLAQALREADGDPRLRAEIHLGISRSLYNEFGGQAARHSRIALELAQQVGDPELLALTLAYAAQSEFRLGNGVDHAAMSKAVALERRVAQMTLDQRPTTTYAWMLTHSGDIVRARPLFERLRKHAREQGDSDLGVILWLSAFHELLSEDWVRAASYAGESVASARESARPVDERDGLLAQAVVAAHLGDAASARAAVEAALPLTIDDGADAFLSGWAVGLTEFSLGRPAAALEALRPATESQLAAGWEEPNVRLSIDLHVESAIADGQLDEARELIDWIEPRARRLDRPWALAVAARGRALLAAVNGNEPAADAAFEAAYEHVGRPQPFPRFGLARTLLAHGTILRRRHQKRAAHDQLTQALAIFERLGARLWTENTRSEITRIGGRAVAAGAELSETERRIADLVCEGRSNKEVAAALSLSPKTVEWNLSKVYRKLGVRSRAQLAASRR